MRRLAASAGFDLITVSSLPLPVSITRGHTLKWCNRALAHADGVSGPEELIGANVNARWPHTDWVAQNRAVLRAGARQTVLSYTVNAAGRGVWVRTVIHPLGRGHVLRVATDCTAAVKLAAMCGLMKGPTFTPRLAGAVAATTAGLIATGESPLAIATALNVDLNTAVGLLYRMLG